MFTPDESKGNPTCTPILFHRGRREFISGRQDPEARIVVRNSFREDKIQKSESRMGSSEALDDAFFHSAAANLFPCNNYTNFCRYGYRSGTSWVKFPHFSSFRQ